MASLVQQLRSRRKVPGGVVEDPDAAEDRSEACLHVQGHQGGLAAVLQTQHLAGSAAPAGKEFSLRFTIFRYFSLKFN